MLVWANQFSICCFLDNHQYSFNHHTYECLAGVGMVDCIESMAGAALQQLQQFQQKHDGWIFGHLGYDLKNETEDIYSDNPDHICFPDLFFFVPETVLLLNKKELCIAAGDASKAAQVFDAVEQWLTKGDLPKKNKSIFSRGFQNKTILKQLKSCAGHILRGDCYEINFCQEFFAENAADRSAGCLPIAERHFAIAFCCFL